MKRIVFFILNIFGLRLFGGMVIVDEITTTQEGTKVLVYAGKCVPKIYPRYVLYEMRETKIDPEILEDKTLWEKEGYADGTTLHSSFELAPGKKLKEKFFLGKYYKGKYTPWKHIVLVSPQQKYYTLDVHHYEKINMLGFEILCNGDELGVAHKQELLDDDLNLHVSLKLEGEKLHVSAPSPTLKSTLYSFIVV